MRSSYRSADLEQCGAIVERNNRTAVIADGEHEEMREGGNLHSRIRLFERDKCIHYKQIVGVPRRPNALSGYQADSK